MDAMLLLLALPMLSVGTHMRCTRHFTSEAAADGADTTAIQTKRDYSAGWCALQVKASSLKQTLNM